MKEIDYTEITEITVKSQKELDAVPTDFKGQIYIEFGVPWERASISKKYYCSVVAWGNSSVEARDNSSVVAWDNSSVVAWDNSSVEALGNSSVVAWDNSSVVARGISSVVALGNSSVVARGNSSVVARDNVQVVKRSKLSKISIKGNARLINLYSQNECIETFMDFHGIKHTKTKAVFYKVVHKNNDTYFSDYKKSFTYKIGEVVCEKCNECINESCGTGIHISPLVWALDYGRYWKDLAILELEVAIKDIVVPSQSDGKCRTSKVKVLREVPLEECGLYGKILAKTRGAE